MKKFSIQFVIFTAIPGYIFTRYMYADWVTKKSIYLPYYVAQILYISPPIP